jgi:hypothetical protein
MKAAYAMALTVVLAWTGTVSASCYGIQNAMQRYSCEEMDRLFERQQDRFQDQVDQDELMNKLDDLYGDDNGGSSGWNIQPVEPRYIPWN